MGGTARRLSERTRAAASLVSSKDPFILSGGVSHRHFSIIDGVLNHPDMHDGYLEGRSIHISRPDHKERRAGTSLLGRLKRVATRRTKSCRHYRLIPHPYCHLCGSGRRLLAHSSISSPLAIVKKPTDAPLERPGWGAPKQASRARSATVCPALASHPIQLPKIDKNIKIMVTPPTPDLIFVDSPPVGTPVYKPGHLGLEAGWKAEYQKTHGRCMRLERDLTMAREHEEYLHNLVFDLREQIEDLLGTQAEWSQKSSDDPCGVLDNTASHLGNEILHSKLDRKQDIVSKHRVGAIAFADEMRQPRGQLEVAQEVYPAQAVEAGLQHQIEDEVRGLYGRLINDHQTMQSEFQNRVEIVQNIQQRQRAEKSKMDKGIRHSISNTLESDGHFEATQISKIYPAFPLNIYRSHGRGATPPNEILRDNLEYASDPALPYQLPYIPAPPTLSGIHPEIDGYLARPFNLAGDPQKERIIAFCAGGLRLSSPPFESDPKIAPATELAESDLYTAQTTATPFRFGSPRVQTVPAVYRIPISTRKSRTRENGEDLVPYFNSWEWSSVPDLRLLDPRCADLE